jgi:hypothetical protein
MTNRISHLTVALDKEYRDDDVKAIVSAILMVRGVVDVTEHVADGSSWAVEQRVRSELGDRLIDVLYPDRKKT